MINMPQVLLFPARLGHCLAWLRLRSLGITQPAPSRPSSNTHGRRSDKERHPIAPALATENSTGPHLE